jgi:hypothetical protein
LRRQALFIHFRVSLLLDIASLMPDYQDGKVARNTLLPACQFGHLAVRRTWVVGTDSSRTQCLMSEWRTMDSAANDEGMLPDRQ